MNRLLLHAPNVHTGGGLVLLKDLLQVPNLPLAWCSLDVRAIAGLSIPATVNVRHVRRSLLDRFSAEWQLRSQAHTGDTVLCFHGMPPLFSSKARVVVFLQNRNYLGVNPLRTFSTWTGIRIALERIACRFGKRNVDEYFVQTPSMARLVSAWHGGDPKIRVTPFLDFPANSAVPTNQKRFDFVYVADGEAHKNHRTLLEAWLLLSQDGVRPSLALTLGERDRKLIDVFERTAKTHRLSVENFAGLDRGGVLKLYSDSRALIYPSTSESFGLPLVEAGRVGLPIVAAEADYVRDVSTPVQTFDPTSAISIARAVKRFLGATEPSLKIFSPREFVELLKAT